MKTFFIKFYLVLLCSCLTINAGQAQVNEEVSKVYVVFKTHLDVGFTDLSSVVETLRRRVYSESIGCGGKVEGGPLR